MRPYYEDAHVCLYHGDCREVLPTLGPVDLVLTDPPYGVGFQGKATKHTTAGGGYAGGDSSIGPAVVAAALEIASRGAVFPGIRLMSAYPTPVDVGCVYCPSGAGVGPWGFICYHPILFYGKRPGGPRSPSSIQSFATSDNAGGHPCAKPVRWLTWLVGLASLEDETILDPFAGSGTTLRAAKDLGRRAIGIEIEERYCEIAARRMAQEVLFP